MKFNPEKCYVIHVTKKKIPLKLNYRLHNHTLQPFDNSKYLGVTISKDLDWGPHINNITTKANKTLGFLRRNMKNCIRKVKKLTYTSLVRPVVEYSSPVWNPSKKNSKYLRLSKYKGKQLGMSLMTTVTGQLVQSPI
jgi:hypothetical protein